MPVAPNRFMRTFLDAFERRFIRIDASSRALLAKIPDRDLYKKPRTIENSLAPFSCGEYILRSAGAIEQTCGGLTTRLWDDAFEWTLPEKLATVASVEEYLEDVESARIKAFEFIATDESLAKIVPAPEQLRTILELLVDTVARAEHFQGRAYAIFQTISNEKLPRV